MDVAVWCERYAEGLFGQPANAVTSLAFVVAAAAILAQPRRRQTAVFALLVAGVGVGSFVQHGPHPSWQAYAHDLPLAAVLAYVAVDAASDLLRRELSPAWWLIPAVGMVPVVAAGHGASTAVQATLAVVAVGLSLLRARVRPRRRWTLLGAMALLAAGALIGTVGDRTDVCQPGSFLQGHAIWHVLAAASLYRLAGAVGRRLARVP